jgi:tetratricopeptide (TPR) repeat protein
MALGDVAVELAELRRFNLAIQTADRIQQVPTKDKEMAKNHTSRRNDVLSMIACEQAKCGQAKDALLTVERANDDHVRVKALEQIAKLCIDRGDERNAREAVLKALPIFKRLKASERRALWTLAVFQAELGDIGSALETTSKFVDVPAKGFALMGISLAQAKAGDGASSGQTFKEGIALAKSAKVDDWYTLDDAASLQIQAGQFDRALEIARVVGKPRNILWQVSVGLAKAGDFQRALKISDSLKDDAYAKAVVLSEIAGLQAKAGQPLARQTFQRAFDAAMSDKDLNALKVVGVRQLRAGYVNAAADTFHEVRKEAIQSKYDPEYLVDIGRAQAAGGDSSGALTWARSQSSPLFKACGLVGVVQGLTQGPGE